MDRNVNAEIRDGPARSRPEGSNESEQNSHLDHAAGLGRVGTVWAEHRAGGRAAGADMGDLRSGEEDLVLVGRRKGDRPRVAAGTIQKIGGPIGEAAGRADILEADRQADTRQRRVVAKAVVRQDRPPDRRS